MCKKSVKKFEISPYNAVNPTTCEISALRKLAGFFQYEAPNTSSYICSQLPQNQHNELLKEMLDSWKEENYFFVSHNVTINKFLLQRALLGDNLCSYCKRFVCRRKKKDNNGYKETDFECLLRHLRNALAHGRFFVIHRGNNISLLFEDYYKDSITARIICNQADLKKWKKLIEIRGALSGGVTKSI